MQTKNHKQGKILIVDDERRNLNILQELLMDYDLTEAETGEEALEHLQKIDFDLILLDIMLPGLDGYEVCRKIKSNPQHAALKVLLVSGRALIEEKLQGYAAGADDYITKPFDTEELLAKVRVFQRMKSIEEVDAIHRDFLALLAHEARTPLNGIIGYSDLALDTLASDKPELIEYLSSIKYSAENFHQLVEMILLLCELKTGWVLDNEPMLVSDLAPILERRVANSTCFEKSTLHVDIAEQILIGDQTLLKRSLECLCYSILHRCEKDHEAMLSGKRDGEHFVLAFAAPFTMTEAELERAFLGFASDNVYYHSHFNDLGIYIAKMATEIHSGLFEVNIHEQAGTVFKITLPL
ncbi:response regulator [Oligoflexia bacterium]|nr:response regulator [Oligoflexia bacterium]